MEAKRTNILGAFILSNATTAIQSFYKNIGKTSFVKPASSDRLMKTPLVTFLASESFASERRSRRFGKTSVDFAGYFNTADSSRLDDVMR